MKIKKFVAYVLTLCMSVCVLAIPSSAVNFNNNNSDSVTYVQNNEQKNSVAQNQETSLTKKIVRGIVKICEVKLCAFAMIMGWFTAKEAIHDYNHNIPLTRDIFRRAWNGFIYPVGQN